MNEKTRLTRQKTDSMESLGRAPPKTNIISHTNITCLLVSNRKSNVIKLQKNFIITSELTNINQTFDNLGSRQDMVKVLEVNSFMVYDGMNKTYRWNTQYHSQPLQNFSHVLYGCARDRPYMLVWRRSIPNRRVVETRTSTVFVERAIDNPKTKQWLMESSH